LYQELNFEVALFKVSIQSFVIWLQAITNISLPGRLDIPVFYESTSGEVPGCGYNLNQ